MPHDYTGIEGLTHEEGGYPRRARARVKIVRGPEPPQKEVRATRQIFPFAKRQNDLTAMRPGVTSTVAIRARARVGL